MEGVQDIKLCSACKKTCTEPRTLTCFHSFCLRCLLQSIKRKNSKSEFACPVCEKEYTVSKVELRRNDFIYRLIHKDKETSPSNKDRVLCCICSKDKEKDKSKIPLATTYCITCEQEMCESCDGIHKRQNSSNKHLVFGLGRQDNEEKGAAKYEGNLCQEHTKKNVELYCMNCKVVICMICFAETHKFHNCIDLDKFKEQPREQIKENCSITTGCLKSCQTMKDRLSDVEREFRRSADAANADIDKRSEDLKQMIDRHANRAKEELKDIKQQKLNQISENKKALDKLIRDLKTLESYCSELASSGLSMEMNKDVAGIAERKTELKQRQEKETERELRSLNVFFKPEELEEYEQDKENIVGNVQVVATCVRKQTVVLDLHSDSVLGVAKLKGSIYVLGRSLSKISILVANGSHSQIHSKQETWLTEIREPIDMAASELNNCLYITDRGNKCIWKLTPDLRLTRWKSWIWQPMTMSISRHGHVIMVRNDNPPIIDLYGSRGELIDQYRIPVVLLSPRHVVETSDGDFVILHKIRDWKGEGRMEWGLSKMNREGKVLCRFVPSDPSQRLCRPHRLSVDDDDRVFVVDPGAERLTMLGSNLNWITDYPTKGCDKIKNLPLTLCYDKRKKCLLIGRKFSEVFMLSV